MVLYEIKNKIDSKKYVGITNNLKRRWKEHRSELRGKRHGNQHLQFAWNKYEEKSFEFNIINSFNNLDELNKAEIDYINRFDLKNPKKGYNIADGGNSFEHTSEAKQAISTSQEVSVIRKCLETGKEYTYKRILDVELDGFDRKSIANACTDRALTYQKNVWMYFKDYEENSTKLLDKYKTRQNVKARPSRYRKVYGMNIKTKDIVEYAAVYHTKNDGFSYQTVNKCCKQPNISKSHRGYVWSFDKKELEDKIAIVLCKKTHKVYKD
jgi:group I intron endonuclease